MSSPTASKDAGTSSRLPRDARWIDFTKIVRKEFAPTAIKPTADDHRPRAALARGPRGRGAVRARAHRSQTQGDAAGPMTIVDTLHDAHYNDRKKAAFAFAEAIRAEIEELAAAGVDVVQLDEPAFNVYFQELEDWGSPRSMPACAASAARPRSTCATATGSKRTSIGSKARNRMGSVCDRAAAARAEQRSTRSQSSLPVRGSHPRLLAATATSASRSV